MELIFVDFFSNFPNLPLSTEQSGQSEVDFLLYYYYYYYCVFLLLFLDS